MQRRTDIQLWRFDDKKEDGYFYRIISKAKKRGKESYIRLPEQLPMIHSEFSYRTLEEIMTISRKEMAKNNYITPCVIQHKPEKRWVAKDKSHWTQLSRNQISRGFREARDKSGFFKELNEGEALTLHECIGPGRTPV